MSDPLTIEKQQLGSAGASARPKAGILLSLHLTSNRPRQFEAWLDRLQAATDDVSSMEVIVKIDDTDTAMNQLLDHEVRRRPFRIRYVSTPLKGGFYGLWEAYNDLLLLSDPDAYFVMGLNDESYFSARGWDTSLRRYVGLFPDHIFRLRTSPRRLHNYFDFWEAGFANDTGAIMTKRWIEIGGNWCPCNGPDTFQQTVAFYFGYNDRFNYRRLVQEVPISDITITYEGAELGRTNLGLTGDALKRRLAGAILPWFALVSHRMQEEASRRAEKLRAHIWAHSSGIDNFDLTDYGRRKGLTLREKNPPYRTKIFPYRLGRLRITLVNCYRMLNYVYYGGGGRTIESSWADNFNTLLNDLADLEKGSNYWRAATKVWPVLVRIARTTRALPRRLLSLIASSDTGSGRSRKQE